MQDPQRQRGVGEVYARYATRTYSIIPNSLLAVVGERRLGKNGTVVLIALCGTVYADGKLGRMGSAAIQSLTKLNEKQVERGMADLRNRKIIEPIRRTNSNGKRRLDRSSIGHIAQYRIASDIWTKIARN